jgi:hypothetical protein
MSALGHKQTLFPRFFAKADRFVEAKRKKKRLPFSAALGKQTSYFVCWKSRIRLFERSSSKVLP